MQPGFHHGLLVLLIAGVRESEHFPIPGVSGNRVRAAAQEGNTMSWIEGLGQDARFAFRLLAKERWFTAASTAALALGIGVTSMMVTIINGYNFRGLPVPDHSRIVHIGTVDSSGRDRGVSYPDYQDLRRASRSFASLGAFAGARITISEPGRSPESLGGAYMSAESFGILGVAPLLGRGLSANDDRRDAPPVVILGHRLWTSRYGGDPAVLGQSVLINRAPATVVGVMPDGFEFPFREGLWLPLAMLPGLETQARDDRALDVFGRLGSGVSPEQAKNDLDAIAAGLARTYPLTNEGVRPAVVRFGVQQVGRFGQDLPPLAILATAVFVLLIACANVANLLLARSAGRSRELAIRASLGATRWRILRQLFAESLVLSTIAGAFGLWLSTFGVRYIAESFGRNVPYWMSFPIDAQVLATVALLCVLSTVLFGLAPALTFSKTPPGGAMKEGGASSRALRAWTQALLVGELAMTVVLLAGSGLILRSFLALYQADQVIDASQVQTMQMELPESRFATPEQRSELYRRLDERLGQLPGSSLASVASSRPFAGALSRRVAFSGRETATGDAAPTVSVVAIGPRYFDTLQVRVLRGRYFTPLDGSPGQQTAIVNQRFVDLYFPAADPIGERIRLTEPKVDEATAPWLTIVGVAPTIRQNIASAARPAVYIPLVSYRGSNAAILVSGAATTTSLLRAEVASLDPDVTLFNSRPLRDLRNDSRLQHRLMASLLAVLAGIALLLAVVGVYAATAYAVRQRLHEVGVRMALGAQAWQVVWLFVRRGLTLLAIGLPIGLAGAVAVGAVLRGLLINTRPTDALTLVLITGLVALVTVAACLFPARRAVRRDPLRVLRSE
jgi:predicted permease